MSGLLPGPARKASCQTASPFFCASTGRCSTLCSAGRMTTCAASTARSSSCYGKRCETPGGTCRRLPRRRARRRPTRTGLHPSRDIQSEDQMEYRVVKKKISAVLARNVAILVDEFGKEVHEQLKGGWEALGGVAVGTAGSHTYLFQAVVKRR